jgi:hypothetical protein
MLKKTAEISAVFRDKLRVVDFIKNHKIGITSFTRSRKLGFDKIMTMIIKKSNKSLQNSLNDMQLDLKEDCTITNSAYTQARAKLNYTAFVEFADMARDIFYKDDEYAKYNEFRLLAIDGSVIILPNSKDITKEFNSTINKCQINGWEKEIVQARASVLFDVLNNIAIDSKLANKNNSATNELVAYDERTLASQHLKCCTMQDLVIMDRGYPSYELFASFHNKTNLLFRIRKNSFKEASSLFAPHCEKKDIVLEIKAPKHLKEKHKEQNLPTTMQIRFIQVILDNGEVEVLATNVLNNTILQTTDFKELYSKRWGIETYYDLIKNRLKLENFTGLSALAIKQDFYATIFLTNYESAMTYDLNEELKEKTQDNKFVQKVNKSISFNVIKHKVFDLFYGDKPLNVMLKHMEKLFLTNTITIRPNRKSNPRLDKEKQKSTIATNSINYLKRKKKNVGN